MEECSIVSGLRGRMSDAFDLDAFCGGLFARLMEATRVANALPLAEDFEDALFKNPQ